LSSFLNLHLSKKDQTKIHCVDAHDDEQEREYDKFNNGSTRYSILSDQKPADGLSYHKARSVTVIHFTSVTMLPIGRAPPPPPPDASQLELSNVALPDMVIRYAIICVHPPARIGPPPHVM